MNQIESADLAKVITGMIARPGDNFIIDAEGHITYSRLCRGGTYEYVGRFSISQDTRVRLHGSTHPIQWVDLGNPDSFEKLAEILLREVESLQTERLRESLFNNLHDTKPTIRRG